MPVLLRIVALAALSLAASLGALAQRAIPQQLTRVGGADNDAMGSSAAVSCDFGVVGVPKATVGAIAAQGAVQVFLWSGSWSAYQTLTASDGEAGDQFGACVAILGNTIVVGAPQRNEPGRVQQGAAYVFKLSGGIWSQTAKLLASDPGAGTLFGSAVAIDNNAIVVGASGVDTNSGAAYYFSRHAGAWSEVARLTAADAASNDKFGASIAMSGSLIVVGAPGKIPAGNTASGAAYTFAGDENTPFAQQKLLASDGFTAGQFGAAVACNSAIVVVGAPGHTGFKGAAYHFGKTAGVWTERSHFAAADSAAPDNFGASLGLDRAGTLVVGAPGHVGTGSADGAGYAFTVAGNVWTQQGEFMVPDRSPHAGLGSAAAIDGDLALIGASLDSVDGNPAQGSAWGLIRVGTDWADPDFRLAPGDPHAGDQFGQSAAISGTTIGVGAPNFDDANFTDRGAEYIYVKDGPFWAQQARLIGNATPSSRLGTAADLEGDRLLVAAPGFTNGTGRSFIFNRTGTTWTLAAGLTDAAMTLGDSTGASVALARGGDTALLGAPGSDTYASEGGALYTFDRLPTGWQLVGKSAEFPAAASDAYGQAVTGDGIFAAFGSPFANSNTGYVQMAFGNHLHQLWNYSGTLQKPDKAADDRFGFAVSLSGNELAVGAPTDDAGAVVDAGSVSVFTLVNNIWTFEGSFTPQDCQSGDNFGRRVAIFGDVLVAGAPFQDVNGQADAGAAYIYRRINGQWIFQWKFVSPNPQPGDNLGCSVAINGSSIVVGVMMSDLYGADAGAAYVLPVPPADQTPSVINQRTMLTYSSIVDALAAAQSGDTLLATPTAFANSSAIDTAWRSVSLVGTQSFRVPFYASLTLANGSALTASTFGPVDLFGSLTIPAGQSGGAAGQVLRTGVFGAVTTNNGSSLGFGAFETRLFGATTLGKFSTLTSFSSTTNFGAFTQKQDSLASFGGAVINYGDWSLSDAGVQASTFTNHESLTSTGASVVDGDLLLRPHSGCTIRSGSLLVTEDFTSYATLTGTMCTGCVRTPPVLDVLGDADIYSGAAVMMPLTGSLVRVGGSYLCRIDSNERYDMRSAELQMETTGSLQTLEAMSTDVGAAPGGLDRSFPGHYPLGTLHLGPSPSDVAVVDIYDNDATPGCEAIYVETIIIDAGSTLDLSGCSKVYYNNLFNHGTVINMANLLKVGSRCTADITGDGTIDLDDYFTFFNCWDTSAPCADLDHNDELNLSDFFLFFNAWDDAC